MPFVLFLFGNNTSGFFLTLAFIKNKAMGGGNVRKNLENASTKVFMLFAFFKFFIQYKESLLATIQRV